MNKTSKSKADKVAEILGRIIRRATTTMSDGDILLSDIDAAKIALAEYEAA